MCKIIQFPTKETIGFLNLKNLFKTCETVESCNFYLESVEHLAASGDITEKEMYTLRRIGRTKRIELAHPKKQEPIKPEQPGTYIYTPEMGQEKPDCQMEASISHYGNHVYIDTPLEIKGRGITFIKKYSASDFLHSNNHKIGWNAYRVTNAAFEKLKTQYTISMECLLD